MYYFNKLKPEPKTQDQQKENLVEIPSNTNMEKENPEEIKNPFKRTSPFDSSCLAKVTMVTVAGYGMGFLMALFMNAVEMRDHT